LFAVPNGLALVSDNVALAMTNNNLIVGVIIITTLKNAM